MVYNDIWKKFIISQFVNFFFLPFSMPYMYAHCAGIASLGKYLYNRIVE